MIKYKQVACPNCNQQTGLAVAILQLKDLENVDQNAVCKRCNTAYIFHYTFEIHVTKK